MRYVIVFEDLSMAQTDHLDQNTIQACFDNYISIIDTQEMKTLAEAPNGEQLWFAIRPANIE